MDKRGLKRKVVMVQLRVLGMLGMHEKKAQVLRNSIRFLSLLIIVSALV